MPEFDHDENTADILVETVIACAALDRQGRAEGCLAQRELRCCIRMK
jgi:hypothetical protein